MTKPLKNMGTSVRTKLLQLAKERGDDFQLVLLRFVLKQARLSVPWKATWPKGGPWSS